MMRQDMPRRLPQGCVEDRDQARQHSDLLPIQGQAQGSTARHTLYAGVYGPISSGQMRAVPDD
jgi:hypothetical protein